MGGRGASSGNAVKSRFKNLKDSNISNTTNKNTSTPLTNKNNIIEYVKKQINVDLSNVLEESVSKSRTYLGVHLENLNINQRNSVKHLLNKRGIKIEDNGGLGNAIYYERKSK